MDRSSRHALRAERISASPYKRPQSSGITKSSSGTFSTVKSLFSYALSPLFRSSSSANLTLPSTTSDLPVEVEQRSESGSEDGWNGEPPSMTENGEDADREDGNRAVDLYDLAAAGGRSGGAFEERASQWRARGEIVGGRRDVARRILEGQPVPATISTPASSSTPNGQTNGISDTGDIAQSTAQKRPRSAIMTTPLKSTLNGVFAPTPSFLPPASGSPGSAALAAFLDAKKGSTMTAEDLRVIDSLTDHLHVEAGSPRQAGKEVQYGGWSAGMSPRVTKPIPGARGQFSTPSRSTFASPSNTPGSTFSVGTSTPLGSASKPSSYRVRYLGPGMSPKRMLGKQGGSGLKPLRHFGPTAEDSEESATKKRKVDESLASGMDVEAEQSRPQSSLSHTVSLPDLASVSASLSASEQGKSKAGSLPHPLRQSTVATPEPEPAPAPIPKDKPDYVAKGKQRAANIIRELVEEQLAPAEAAKAAGALTSDIVINPYDVSSSRTSTPPETRVFESPRKSTLRASARGTPKRGAAAKLELHRSTGGSKTSTPSPIKSTFSTRTQSATSAEKRTAAETPTTGTKEAHLEEMPEDEDELPKESSTVASTKEVPRQPKEIKEPEPFKPYDVPVLDTPSRPIPSFASPSVAPFAPSSTAIGAVQKPDEPAPKFTLSAPKPIAPVEEDKLDIVATSSKTGERKDKYDASKIWLSAKDTVLAIAKPALPFFTFDPIKSSSKDGDDAKRAKEEALKAPIVQFTFTFPSSPAKTSVPAPTPFQWPSGNGPSKSSGEWVCDTCMCKSPDSASKCVVCEEPRPKSTSSAPALAPVASTPAPAAKPFQWPTGSAPAKASAEWVCDTCMCKSPDSASKCVVCEEPRPQSTGSASEPATAASAPPSVPPSAPAPASAPTPFQWPSGSAAPKQSSDEWTCSTCMCKSPMSASKCVVCETPK